jgi:curved DNA-binding protein CbpA
LSYYEDFGVPPHSSPEQIRETYKLLVRLLHPDQHTDPALKRAAEMQMRRINQAYAVLSDPERRRRYDADFRTPPERLTPPPPERAAPLVIRKITPVGVSTQLQKGMALWIGAAILSLGILFWLSTQAQSQQAQRNLSKSSTGNPAAVPHEEGPMREPQPGRRYPNAPTPPSTPSQHLPEGQPIPQGTNQAAPQNPVEVQAVAAPQPEPPTFASPQLPVPEPAHVFRNRYAGFWAYPHEKNFQRQTGQYPPQFIEASISEHDGSIHGKYRARYYVSDRPISPNVNFEFDGKPEGDGAKLPWHGEGGSQGLVEIKLLSGDEMELIWKATDFGQVLGLASGTAVLMRRPD